MKLQREDSSLWTAPVLVYKLLPEVVAINVSGRQFEDNTPYLFVKSLKQRRSLLWCLKSFGSFGISDKKTCATSNGPFRSKDKKYIFKNRLSYPLAGENSCT